MPKRSKNNRKAKMEKRQEMLGSLQAKRSLEERRHETLNILYQLKQQSISSKHEAVKTLVEKMNDYVNLGIDVELSIPFPEMNKTIKGKLPVYKNENPVVYLAVTD